MKFETYKKICEKHKINPNQIIADKNIQGILNDDVDKDLKFYENYCIEKCRICSKSCCPCSIIYDVYSNSYHYDYSYR